MSADFNDPRAWGYCKYCAFVVARDLETGNLLVHTRRTGSYDTERCYGSLLDPSPQPGPEVKPVAWEDEIVNALSETDATPVEVEVINVVRGTD